MSTTIDSKVVQMRFDNANFERNVNQSISTLDKLKKALKLDGAAESFQEIGDAAGKMHLDKAIDESDRLGQSFNALEQISIGVFRRMGEMITENVTNKLISTAKELSGLNNAIAGYGKYEQKTNAMQIMQSALPDLDLSDIEEKLETLNWFSDETSYGFTDMTDALSKFVAAGQKDLDKDVTAIQGIATWAASAGVNARDASRAFYNLAQAMGLGALTAADWKSIELLNMGTYEFKEVAIAAGLATGTLHEVDGIIKVVGKDTEVTAENFRETLSDKWLDTDTMMTVFGQYGEYATGLKEFMDASDGMYDTASQAMVEYDKQLEASGEATHLALAKKAFEMAQVAKTFGEAIDSVKDAASTTWMNIIQDVVGDLDQAKELWTNVANKLWDIFVGPLAEFEGIMSEWSKGGGRENFLSGLTDGLKALGAIADAVITPIKEIFGSLEAWQLLKWSSDFKNAMVAIQPSESLLNRISSAVRVLVTPLKWLADILTNYVWPATKTIVSFLVSVGGGFASLLGGIGNAILGLGSAFKETESEGSGFRKFFNNLLSSITKAGKKIAAVLVAIGNGFSAFGAKIAGTAIHTERFQRIQKIVEGVSKVFQKLFGWLTPSLDSTTVAGDRFINFFINLADQVMGTADGPLSTFVGVLISVAEWVLKTGEKIYNFCKEPVARFIEGMKDAASATWEFLSNLNVSEAVTNAFDKIKNFFSWVGEKLHIDGAIQAVKDFFKSFGKSDDANTEGIDDINEKLSFSEKILDKLKGMWEAIKNAADFVWGYIKMAGDWIWEKMKKIWDWVDSTFGPVIDQIQGKFKKIGEEIQNGDFGSAIALLTELLTGAAIVKLIGFLKNLNDTTSGPAKIMGAIKDAIEDITEAIVGGMKSVSLNLKADAMKKIAEAILMIVGAMIAMSFVDQEKVKNTTAVMVIMMAELAQVVKEFGKSTKGMSSMKDGAGFAIASTSFLAIAGALFIMATALTILTLIKPEKLQLGLFALSILIEGMISIMKASRKANDNFGTFGKSLKKIAGTLLIMTGVIWLLGSMSEDKLKQGGIALAIMIVVLGLFTKLAGKTNENFDKVGKTFTKMAWALVIMSAAIYILGRMDEGTLWVGVTILSILIGVLALFAILTTRLGGDAAKLEGMGKTFIAMSFGLILMAAAIAILGKVNPDNMLDAAGALLLLSSVILIFLAITSVAGNAGATKGVGATFVAIALGIMMLAGAILMLKDVDPEKIWTVVGALSVLIVVVGAMVALVAIALAKLNSSKSGLLKEKALNTMAKAIDRISKSITRMINAITMLVASLIIFLGLIVGLPLIFDLMGEAIVRGSEFIKANLGTIADNVLGGIDDALIALKDHMPSMAQSIIESIAIMLNELRKALPGMLQDIKDILFMAMDFLVGTNNLDVDYGELEVSGAPDGKKLSDRMNKDGNGAGKSFMDSIGDGIDNNQKSLLDKLFETLHIVLDGVYKFIKDETGNFVKFLVDELVIILDDLGTELETKAQDIIDGAVKLINALGYILAGIVFEIFHGEDAEALWDTIGEWWDGVVSKIKEKIQALKDWVEELKNVVMGFFADMTGRKAQYDDFFGNPIIQSIYSAEQLERGRKLMEGKIASSKWTDEDRQLVNDLTAYMNGDVGFDKTYIIRDGKIVELANNYGGLKGWEVEDLKAQGQTFEYDELLAEIAKGTTTYATYDAAKAALDALNPQHYAYEDQSQKYDYDKTFKEMVDSASDAVKSFFNPQSNSSSTTNNTSSVEAPRNITYDLSGMTINTDKKLNNLINGKLISTSGKTK